MEDREAELYEAICYGFDVRGEAAAAATGSGGGGGN
jgi:hypothetical protein